MDGLNYNNYLTSDFIENSAGQQNPPHHFERGIEFHLSNFSPQTTCCIEVSPPTFPCQENEPCHISYPSQDCTHPLPQQNNVPHLPQHCPCLPLRRDACHDVCNLVPYPCMQAPTVCSIQPFCGTLNTKKITTFQKTAEDYDFPRLLEIVRDLRGEGKNQSKNRYWSEDHDYHLSERIMSFRPASKTTHVSDNYDREDFKREDISDDEETYSRQDSSPRVSWKSGTSMKEEGEDTENESFHSYFDRSGSDVIMISSRDKPSGLEDYEVGLLNAKATKKDAEDVEDARNTDEDDGSSKRSQRSQRDQKDRSSVQNEIQERQGIMSSGNTKSNSKSYRSMKNISKRNERDDEYEHLNKTTPHIYTAINSVSNSPRSKQTDKSQDSRKPSYIPMGNKQKKSYDHTKAPTETFDSLRSDVLKKDSDSRRQRMSSRSAPRKSSGKSSAIKSVKKSLSNEKSTKTYIDMKLNSKLNQEYQSLNKPDNTYVSMRNNTGLTLSREKTPSRESLSSTELSSGEESIADPRETVLTPLSPASKEVQIESSVDSSTKKKSNVAYVINEKLSKMGIASKAQEPMSTDLPVSYIIRPRKGKCKCPKTNCHFKEDATRVTTVATSEHLRKNRTPDISTMTQQMDYRKLGNEKKNGPKTPTKRSSLRKKWNLKHKLAQNSTEPLMMIFVPKTSKSCRMPKKAVMKEFVNRMQTKVDKSRLRDKEEEELKACEALQNQPEVKLGKKIKRIQATESEIGLLTNANVQKNKE